jgi:prolyl-tRNA editing enzyme YbaK/EbsC (Cys-tRNA(Pro) deacylase)
MVSSSQDVVEAALRAAGVRAELRTFDQPVPTAAAAALALGCEVGAIANSLVFELDGTPLLVLASGAHRVDTKKLARGLCVGKIRRATPDFVLEHTGQHVGGVAPVGHPRPVRPSSTRRWSTTESSGPGLAMSAACSRRTFRDCWP